MPTATKKKAIRTKTIPRRPKYKPRKELTLTQKRTEYKKYLDVRREDKAKQERNRAKTSSSIESAKAKKFRVREQEKRATGFSRRKDTIAIHNIRQADKTREVEIRKLADIEKTGARKEASAERINKRYAIQTQLEEERLQRRTAYQEVRNAQQMQRSQSSTASKSGSGISRSVSEPVSEGSTSIVGGISRILAVIVGLALLLFIVSHADQSSGAINNFGNILFGLTSNKPLFTPVKPDTKSATKGG